MHSLPQRGTNDAEPFTILTRNEFLHHRSCQKQPHTFFCRVARQMRQRRHRRGGTTSDYDEDDDENSVWVCGVAAAELRSVCRYDWCEGLRLDAASPHPQQVPRVEDDAGPIMVSTTNENRRRSSTKTMMRIDTVRSSTSQQKIPQAEKTVLD